MYIRYWTGSEIFFGILFAAIFLGIVIAAVWLFTKGKNKSAEKCKNDNSNVATIWITQEKYWGVNIKKVDGKKVKTFHNGITSVVEKTYILPGEHILVLKHQHADPKVQKSANYKNQRHTEFKILVEAGQEYILQFNEYPGEYTLVKGKPKNQ